MKQMAKIAHLRKKMGLLKKKAYFSLMIVGKLEKSRKKKANILVYIWFLLIFDENVYFKNTI